MDLISAVQRGSYPFPHILVWDSAIPRMIPRWTFSCPPFCSPNGTARISRYFAVSMTSLTNRVSLIVQEERAGDEACSALLILLFDMRLFCAQRRRSVNYVRPSRLRFSLMILSYSDR